MNRLVLINPKRSEGIGTGQRWHKHGATELGIRRVRPRGFAIRNRMTKTQPCSKFVWQPGQYFQQANRPVVSFVPKILHAQRPTRGKTNHQFRKSQRFGPVRDRHWQFGHATGYERVVWSIFLRRDSMHINVNVFRNQFMKYVVNRS